jgi:UDP-N-acetylglucosamine 2-epimerase (non-hydrolysing)
MDRARTSDSSPLLASDSKPPLEFGRRRSAGGNVAVVLGTRPEIIKLAPVAAALGSRARLIWTDQHYDPLLADIFFERLGWKQPLERLSGVGGSSRVSQVLAVMAGLAERFDAQRPSVVVVQGDTNTTNAGAQAAHYVGVPVVHVEAGLRSFDRSMPEEINRLVVGSVADLHCCATLGNAQHLRDAGVVDSAIRITGNPIVEATVAALPDEAEQRRILAGYGITPERYLLATVHRPENTDDPLRLALILAALESVGAPVLFPVHPRTASAISRYGLRTPPTVKMVPPIDHPTFLALQANARLIVSDSGGVQEEVTVLKRPLVVVRNSTERPEAHEAGFAYLARPDELRPALNRMLDPALPAQLAAIPSPFGDGQAGARIAAEIVSFADRAQPVVEYAPRLPVPLSP